MQDTPLQLSPNAGIKPVIMNRFSLSTFDPPTQLVKEWYQGDAGRGKSAGSATTGDRITNKGPSNKEGVVSPSTKQNLEEKRRDMPE